MNELLLILVMGLYSACNQRHDALNSGAHKWPNSGFQIVWNHGIRIHLPSAEGMHDWRGVSFVGTVTVIKTIDRWHLWKWAMFYNPPVYILSLCIWPSLIPNPWAFIPATALATVIWKVLPKPEHWK